MERPIVLTPKEVSEQRASCFRRAAAFAIAGVGTVIGDVYLTAAEHMGTLGTATFGIAAGFVGACAVTELMGASDTQVRAENQQARGQR